MSINRWMDKEDVVPTYDGILFSHKKEWNNAICSSMDATRGKWSKLERERQILRDITCIWNLKYNRVLPWWLSGKQSACQCRRQGFDPWSGKMPHAVEGLNPVPWLLSLGSRAWEPGLACSSDWSLHTPEPVVHSKGSRHCKQVRSLHVAKRG